MRPLAVLVTIQAVAAFAAWTLDGVGGPAVAASLLRSIGRGALLLADGVAIGAILRHLQDRAAERRYREESRYRNTGEPRT